MNELSVEIVGFLTSKMKLMSLTSMSVDSSRVTKADDSMMSLLGSHDTREEKRLDFPHVSQPMRGEFLMNKFEASAKEMFFGSCSFSSLAITRSAAAIKIQFDNTHGNNTDICRINGGET